MKSLEQQSREILVRMGIEGAESMTSGEVVEISNLLNEVAKLRNQRDLAVEAIENIFHYIDDKNEMRLLDEHVSDDDEANSAVEYNEQLDGAVAQLRSVVSAIKESEGK